MPNILTPMLSPVMLLQPCCYFARNSCMKGDDCPFDHQLSRYPCDNYVKGFCSRGDTCMFSHEVPSCSASKKICLNTVAYLFKNKLQCIACVVTTTFSYKKRSK